MDITDLFDDAHDGAFFKIIGTKIQDKLRELRQSRPEENARRWGWELIQNAKDVAYPDRPVHVWFDLEEGATPRLVARHSGRPFRPDHLYYLIVQTSSKDRPAGHEAPTTTGRYGTGFLTTHLLSPVVEVEGVLEAPGDEPVAFSVVLDRGGKTLDELTEAVKRSLSIRERFADLPRVGAVDPDAFNTAFTYSLDWDGTDVARQGLEDLERSVPLTLAFTPSVGGVRVRQTTFRTTERVAVVDGVERVRITSSGPEGERSHWFVVAHGERTGVAVRVEVRATGVRLLPLGGETPRLFCDFPLLGSEGFPLPFAVNSPYFYPDDARSGVFLEDDADAEVRVNRAALGETVGLLGRILAVATEAEWADAYRLAAFGMPDGFGKGASSWYAATVLEPARRALLEAPVVETASGERRPLRKPLDGEDHVPYVWIPTAKDAAVREGIWRFASAEPGRTAVLPCKEHLRAWDDLAWSQCGTLDLSLLVGWTSRHGDVATLAECHGVTEAEALSWLNDFVSFVLEHGHEGLLSPHKQRSLYTYEHNGRYQWKQEQKHSPILPNQHGAFCAQTALYLDDGIGEELKDIAADLGHDVRAVLLDRAVFLEERHVKGTTTRGDVARAIEEAVKDRVNGTRDEGTRRAFYALYLWIQDHDAEARDLFGMWLYENRALLVPPEDVIGLMDRVPELEAENETLRAEQEALMAEQAAAVAERDQLRVANETLKTDAQQFRELQRWLEAEGIDWSTLPALLEGRRELAERALEIGQDEPVAELVRELRELNITTVAEFEAYVREHPEAFRHHPEGTAERYVLFRQKAERAQAAVREHLGTLGHYDLSGWQSCPERPTVVLGVRRRDRAHGRPLLLVVRPSDGGRVIFYHAEELAALRDAEAELWVEDPDRGVQRLTLGRVLEELRDRLGVNQLPVS